MTSEPEIIQSVDALPLSAREAILVVDGMGFRYEEACAVLDLDSKTLALRLHQARSALQLRTVLTPHHRVALAGALS